MRGTRLALARSDGSDAFARTGHVASPVIHRISDRERARVLSTQRSVRLQADRRDSRLQADSTTRHRHFDRSVSTDTTSIRGVGTAGDANSSAGHPTCTAATAGTTSAGLQSSQRGHAVVAARARRVP